MKLKVLFLLMNVISISAEPGTYAPNEFATLHLKAHRIQEQDLRNS